MQDELSTDSSSSDSEESFFNEENLDASEKAPSVGDDYYDLGFQDLNGSFVQVNGDDFGRVSIDDNYDVKSIDNDDVAFNDDLASHGSFVQVDDLEDDFVDVNFVKGEQHNLSPITN